MASLSVLELPELSLPRKLDWVFSLGKMFRPIQFLPWITGTLRFSTIFFSQNQILAFELFLFKTFICK
jgi:hypothetical protein